jgi:multidrug efflux pump subunit AcrA (membrane-fusion protein)
MIRKYVLPVLALCGLVLAVFVVIQGSKAVPAAQPVAEPAAAPYDSYVAGAGLVEAATENIAIGTGVGGTVTEVFAKVGDVVKQGDPLFRVRDKTLRAELASQQAAVRTARAQLEKLKAHVREEDVAAARARVAEAEAVLADAKNALELYESVPDKRAIVQEELTRRRYAVKGNQARVDAARPSWPASKPDRGSPTSRWRKLSSRRPKHRSPSPRRSWTATRSRPPPTARSCR